MEESTSKEKILKNVRNALINKSDNPYPAIDLESSVFYDIEESLDINFAQKLTEVSGKFVFCENEDEFLNNLKSLISENKWNNIFCLEKKIQKLLTKAEITFDSGNEKFLNIKIGITYCEYLISRLGSIMISSKQTSGRRLNVFPETHIVLAYTSQLVPDIKDAIKNIKKKYNEKMPSMISVITGPSRTADIEKTLVMGAHGPKELYVFLIDDNT
ncbi:MAG: LUD domain-containing protein [Bacteroidales bacterium]|nr:LUD domain-containing protein [Bacteroidales bacterium]